MDVFHSLAGMVEIEIITADMSAFLDAAVIAGIELYSVASRDEVTLSCCVMRSSFRKLKQLVHRRGETLKLRGKHGAYWYLKRLLRRPVLVIGMSLLLFLLLFLPSRVLFVRVEGNNQIPDRQILEAAESCGICFGASRRAVRSERMKNALLYQLPQLQWAGINTYGCAAVISVREGVMPQIPEGKNGVCSIVALRDGIITSCNATSGNLLCRTGQAVRAGEILISGYTDCGISIQATRAQGEIYGRTVREISMITPAAFLKKEETGKMKGSISVILGKKRINLWKDSGIWDTTCDRIYEEYYVTLPGGFQLPMALALEKYGVYETRKLQREYEAAMKSSGIRYIQAQMIAGNIESQEVTISPNGDTIRLAGKYICSEMIGKVQWEQIGDKNGQSG